MLLFFFFFFFHFFFYLFFFFFFQAEDGIRDKLVTGVQTCALPISSLGLPVSRRGGSAQHRIAAVHREWPSGFAGPIGRGCSRARAMNVRASSAHSRRVAEWSGRPCASPGRPVPETSASRSASVAKCCRAPGAAR